MEVERGPGHSESGVETILRLKGQKKQRGSKITRRCKLGGRGFGDEQREREVLGEPAGPKAGELKGGLHGDGDSVHKPWDTLRVRKRCLLRI